MASEKLIELTADKLPSGMFPSAEPAAGPTWRTGKNVWFRELNVDQVLGRQKIVGLIGGRTSMAMNQVFTTGGVKRIYYEDFGAFFRNENGVSTLIDSLDVGGDYDTETWGDWLIATDDINHLKYWNGTGGFVDLGDAASNFAHCSIVKRLAQHLLAYNTDQLPTGFHWCTANDPTIWTPDLTNSARNLNIRNLDSEIIAVCPIAAAHGVYSKNAMLVVQYVGPSQWFGTPTQAVVGIGAVSKHSVVSLGQTNYGLSRGGIFVTDGSSFQYIDRPAIDKWLQENVDWTRASTIVGYHNERLGLIVWSVPIMAGGFTCIAVDPQTRQATTSQKTFTYLDTRMGFGIERNIFDYPIISQSDGIYFESVVGTLANDFSLTTNLFNAGTEEYFKSWDYLTAPGIYDSSAQIRVGFTDAPDVSTIEWNPWVPMVTKVPFGPRESIYLALDFQSQGPFRMSGLTVYGEKAGSIN
jgi:hypothetical protein